MVLTILCNGYLVGGFNHLDKYEFVNGKDYCISYILENKKMFHNDISMFFFYHMGDIDHAGTRQPLK